MHHNVLLVAAGLFCSPILAAPNANNLFNPRRGHRQRQAPTPVLSVGGPYRPPVYGPPDDVSVAAVTDTTTTAPDSTSIVIVDPLLPIPISSTTSACSVIKVTEYVTVYNTGPPPTDTASPGNFTSAPYGWNSSTTSSWLLTGTSVTISTSEAPYPISNETTTTAPYGTGESSNSPTFVNVTTTVNVTALPTILPTSTLLVPTNFTSFPNISTPDVTSLLPIPTSSGDIPGNFTSFSNITSTPEISISILPIPVSSSLANVSSVPTTATPEISISILPIPVSPSLANVSSIPTTATPEISISILPIPVSPSFANVTSIPTTATPEISISILPIPVSPSFANVSSVPASTTTEEPTSSDGPTVTSIIILPTETTVVVPGESSTSTVITSLVIDTTVTPIEVATSTPGSTSPTLVIVTTVTPIDTASFTPSEFPTTIVTASDTVSSDLAPTGTPSPETIHCGIRGTGLGVYYLATYAYNRAGVPVTLQGCFQFCSVAVEQCFSYEFYLEPGLGAPRCKLYGGLVAYEVESIDPFQPYQWYDVACGDPTKL